ncbi:MAG: aminotransferase class III-fold pyridoxal phosphate-dependent enzyme, partial [Alphaproteobacteria bacterium]|nr:aminotransferase class III-fold pyridoxal phosphate-dependent enzyme [Alphaproteobacteria bacterium]
PFPAGFLEALREVTAEHGVVLIFDEVVTGFRVSPGGAQAHFGITPDITTLGKIIAGGMPGGAVAGATEILEALDFDATERLGREKIQHQGTFNANPVCCAAGIAALEIIANSDVCERANASGAELRQRLNDVIIEKGVPWAAYGAFSSFQLFTNPQNRDVSPEAFDPFDFDYLELKSNPVGLPNKLRLAMLVNGVDISGWPGGTITAAHTEEDLDITARAFSASLDVLMREGEVQT